MSRRNEFDGFDVLVVGAGLAGLAAATRLETFGFDVQIIEANSRLGGRVWTVESNDERPLERGGQFINGDMHKILARVREAGLTVSSVALGGVPAAFIDGALCATAPDDPFALLLQGGEIRQGQSVGDVLQVANLSAQQRRLTRSMSCDLLCSDPDSVNALATLQHGSHYHSQRHDMEFQIREGLSEIARHMAASLKRAPIMNTPVFSIAIDQQGVAVRAADHVWNAHVCILAMTPTIARRIVVTPGWHPFIAEALSSFSRGAVIKTVLSYASPFWRAHGWSGTVHFAEPAGMTVVDGSRDDGADRLIVFQGGPAALGLKDLTPPQRQALLIRQLVAAFGLEAGSFKSCDEAVWIDDVWCGGGYIARVAKDGADDAAKRLREANGSVVFACSEIADHFPGFMEGALAAGEYAAIQVGKSLAQARKHVA